MVTSGNRYNAPSSMLVVKPAATTANSGVKERALKTEDERCRTPIKGYRRMRVKAFSVALSEINLATVGLKE